ncbi:MAG: hypothetical protein ACLQAT_14615 [Candidatus Binataceae bacterium]
MEKEFTVQTTDDFEAFLLELEHALKLADPFGWPQTQADLDAVITGEREVLPYAEPHQFYLVDESDHVAWDKVVWVERVRLLHLPRKI